MLCLKTTAWLIHSQAQITYQHASSPNLTIPSFGLRGTSNTSPLKHVSLRRLATLCVWTSLIARFISYLWAPSSGTPPPTSIHTWPVTWTKGSSNASLSCRRNGSTEGVKTRCYILRTIDTHTTDTDTYYRYSPSLLSESASLNKNPVA